MASETTDTRERAEVLVSGTVGDRCVSCGTPLSSDQRYCVVCGERRGAPRFSLPAPAAATAESVAAPPKAPRRARISTGTTLVAGVATLLLAMLVGVLIGHDTANNGPRTVRPGQTKISINNGAPASGTASTPGTATTAPQAGGSKPSGKAKASTTKPTTKTAPAIDKKTAQQESSAAAKATGGSGGAAPTQTVGGSCTAGSAGCSKKTHKFNGSFFGG